MRSTRYALWQPLSSRATQPIDEPVDIPTLDITVEPDFATRFTEHLLNLVYERESERYGWQRKQRSKRVAPIVFLKLYACLAARSNGKLEICGIDIVPVDGDGFNLTFDECLQYVARQRGIIK